MSSTAIEALIFIGEFFYALTHKHQIAALVMGVALVLTGRSRWWLLRLFIAIFVIAFIHDWFYGQLPRDLQ